jgi:hypothetical protein
VTEPGPAVSLVVGVLSVLAESWDEIDADFRRHYHLDLADACWGGPDGHGIGFRRLWALLVRLPLDSSLARSRGWAWTHGDELAALAVEVAVNQHRPKGKPMWQYPRPGQPADSPAAPELDRAAVRGAFMGGGLSG